VKLSHATPHDVLSASLPRCPDCLRDLLTGCVHESFVLFCRCGYRLRPEDLAARRLSPDATTPLALLLRTCEGQLAAVTAEARRDHAVGRDPRSEGLDRLLRHLEAQVLLLRALAGQADAGRRRPAARAV
jgi:hypothetical protein